MKKTGKIVFAGVTTIALLMLNGCVSSSKYDELVEQRNALAGRNQELRALAGSLGTEVALRDIEIAQIEAARNELEDEFVRWSMLGTVRIESLADGLHVTLPHDVLFDTGTTDLSGEGTRLIQELVMELKQQPYQIVVVGFSDNVPVGPALKDRFASNWELAGARATRVVRLMEESGIPAPQLLAVSRGETQPIASNDTAEGRAQNRRIDIRIRPIVE